MKVGTLLFLLFLFLLSCNNPVHRPPEVKESTPDFAAYLRVQSFAPRGGKELFILIPAVGCHGCIESMLGTMQLFKQKKDLLPYRLTVGLLARDQGGINRITKKYSESTFDFITPHTGADSAGIDTHFPTGILFQGGKLQKYYVFNAEQAESCWKDLRKKLNSD